MGVMGEEQHLRRSREFRQHPETGLGTLIVEIDEQVVREEGQANTGRDGLLDSCEAKREKELVRGSLRSEEHTSELQSLMRISYAVFCLKKKHKKNERENKIRNVRQNP